MSSSDRDTAVRRAGRPCRSGCTRRSTCPPPARARACRWPGSSGDLDADRVERALCALGAAVLAEVERDPEAQLRALGEAVTNAALSRAAAAARTSC